MDKSMMEKLQTYITAELGDAQLYDELSGNAPSEDARQLLREFAEDERSHADEFKRLYREMTGRRFNPEVAPPVLNDSYSNILRDRVLDESGDFRKYGEQYLMTEPGELRDAFYRARTDEGVHAFRLLYLLNE
jgi:rubrerythrin